MTCKLNKYDAMNKLAHAVGARNPFPDATRASSPAGRRAVADWTMSVITSDAPLHQFRKDMANAGLEVEEKENFVDAMGNLGNVIGDRQSAEANEYIQPMVAALSAVADKHGIRGEAARKQLGMDIGKLREAYHALERQAVFHDIKGKFVGHAAPANSEAHNKAKAAENARKKLNRMFDKGEVNPAEYREALDAIVALTPIDESTTEDLGGMYIDQANKAIAELEAKPAVKAAYGDVKQYIDRVFARVNDIYHKGGKLNDTSARYRELYGFNHYAPVYSADDAENLNSADFMQNVSPGVLQVAEGGVPYSRIPFFPALTIQLNAAAKFSAENDAAWKLHNFAKTHGKQWGLVNSKGGKDVYSISDTGHQVAHETVPANSIPMFVDGKMFWTEIKSQGNKANAQLFKAIQNRFTNQFMAGTSPVDRAIAGAVTHAPARMFTNLNPYFWFNSMVRDPLSVLTNIWLDSRIKDKARVTARAAALMAGEFNHIKAQQYFQRRPELRNGANMSDLVDTSLIGDAMNTRLDSEFAEWMRDLARHGGETVFNRAFYSADYAAVDVKDSADVAVPWNLGGNVEGTGDAAAKAGEVGSSILAFGGNLVTAFDMQARVSVYRALVESKAYNKTEAAAIVREFMDFSQKALKPNSLTTLIPFFRTSTVAAYRAWDSMLFDEAGNFAPKYAVLGTMIALGYMFAVAAKGQDDDDGMAYGDKISHGRAFSHVVVGYDDDGAARSVPMPYGPTSIFLGMGVALERLNSGAHDTGDVMDAYLAHVVKNMTPVAMMEPSSPTADVADSMTGALTQLNPVMGSAVQLMANKDTFGRPIYDESSKFAGTEDWSSRRPGTPELWGDLAEYLYKHSAGMMDVHPETFEYLIRQWTPGGVGRHITGELEREERRNLNSPDAQDWVPLWENVAGSVFLDKSPTMYWHNQYKKSLALFNDIKKREELGAELTPAMIQFRDTFAHHDGWIRSINGSMARMSDEEKLEARYAVRQNMRAAGVAGLDLQKAASWNLLAD